LPILILVICLAVSVLLLLLVIVVCVVRKKSKDASPESGESQRPFHLGEPQAKLQQQQQQLLPPYPGQVAVNMFHKPLPPTPFSAQKWATGTVYPKLPVSADSGYAEHEHSKDMDLSGNQYEVPYAHLLPAGSSSGSSSSGGSSASGNNNRALKSSCCFSSAAPVHLDGAMTSRSGPCSGYSGDRLPYHEKPRKYFSDYDSQ
jgi:hypothetical protein